MGLGFGADRCRRVHVRTTGGRQAAQIARALVPRTRRVSPSRTLAGPSSSRAGVVGGAGGWKRCCAAAQLRGAAAPSTSSADSTATPVAWCRQPWSCCAFGRPGSLHRERGHGGRVSTITTSSMHPWSMDTGSLRHRPDFPSLRLAHACRSFFAAPSAAYEQAPRLDHDDRAAQARRQPCSDRMTTA